MPYEPLQNFTKERIRAILRKHGEAIQASTIVS